MRSEGPEQTADRIVELYEVIDKVSPKVIHARDKSTWPPVEEDVWLFYPNEAPFIGRRTKENDYWELVDMTAGYVYEPYSDSLPVVWQRLPEPWRV